MNIARQPPPCRRLPVTASQRQAPATLRLPLQTGSPPHSCSPGSCPVPTAFSTPRHSPPGMVLVLPACVQIFVIFLVRRDFDVWTQLLIRWNCSIISSIIGGERMAGASLANSPYMSSAPVLPSPPGLPVAAPSPRLMVCNGGGPAGLCTCVRVGCGADC